MSYSAKTKSYRSITVDAVRYRWRFEAGKDDGTLTLQGSESSGQQAVVTLRGCGDPWLALPERKAKAFVVSPKLVRRMVLQAIAAGWEPGKRGAALRIDFTPMSHSSTGTPPPFNVTSEVKEWLSQIPVKTGQEPGFSCSSRWGVFKGNTLVEEFIGDHYGTCNVSRECWLAEQAVPVQLVQRTFWLLPGILEKLRGKTLAFVQKEVGIGKQAGKTRKFLMAVVEAE